MAKRNIKTLSDKDAKLKKFASNIYRKDVKKLTELVKSYYPNKNRLDSAKRKAVAFFMESFELTENNRNTSSEKEDLNVIPKDSVKY